MRLHPRGFDYRRNLGRLALHHRLCPGALCSSPRSPTQQPEPPLCRPTHGYPLALLSPYLFTYQHSQQHHNSTGARIHHPPLHEPLSHNCVLIIMRSLNTTVFGTTEEQALGGFTRHKLKRLSNWNNWLKAESKQLNSMAKHVMYGPPMHPPPGAIILRQHWNYSIKSDGTRKACNCYDGSPCTVPELKLANKYSS